MLADEAVLVSDHPQAAFSRSTGGSSSEVASFKRLNGAESKSRRPA